MTAPLSGIRVIEIANYVAAPSVGALMADLGADVVKVEPPGGEVMRGVIAAVQDGAPRLNYLFELENRGKRSVTIDLDAPGGPDLVHRLLAGADVLLTNLLAPRLERFQLTPAIVRERHPRLVFCSVTGYGLSGPDAARPGFDFAAFWARAGIMSVVGHPGGPPVLSRIAQGDHTTGMNALAAIFAALRLRDLTGDGQVVEVTLQQTGVYTIATDFARTLIDGQQPSRMDRAAPPNPLFNTYPTSDGHWVMLVHMTPDPYWPKLCAAIGRSDLAADNRFDSMRKRMAHGPALGAAIEAAFREHDLAYWSEQLDRHGLIWAPMVELPEVVDDPALRAVNAFPEVLHSRGPFRTVGVPFSIHGSEIGPQRAAPEAGEHTVAVLSEAGLTESEVAELAAARVFG